MSDLKTCVSQGTTIAEAKEAAAKELGVSIDCVDFEVIQEPQKKTFGLFGGTPAKVRATIKETGLKAESAAEKGKNAGELPDDARVEIAADYLRGILAAMGVPNAAVQTKLEADNCLLTINGDNLGFIIGRRGDTLDALQYLVGLVANRGAKNYFRVTLDIEDYRSKRQQSLTGLAKKTGSQVARSGRKVSLEPMNPYERRIIHTAIQEMRGVTSWSVGSEPMRHVVIGPDEQARQSRPYEGNRSSEPNRTSYEKRPQRDDRSGADRTGRSERAEGEKRNDRNSRPERPERPARSDRPERGDRNDRPTRAPSVAADRPPRQIREFVPRSNPLPTADGATPPSKTQSEKESSASLYGRIDL